MTNGSLVATVAGWLREGKEAEVATLIEQCDLDTVYVDTAFEFSGQRAWDMFDVVIAAPRAVFDSIEGGLADHIERIETALRDCAQGEGVMVRNVEWVARPPNASPAQEGLTNLLEHFDSIHVTRAWRKALARKDGDPDGAITAARTLIESVCKHILDAAGVNYPSSAKLPKLYRLTAEQLSLAPEQAGETVFRQVLGSCQSAVEGIAAFRNLLGDAHGKAAASPVPDAVHAELAINLAGTMATFLVSVWESRSDAALD